MKALDGHVAVTPMIESTNCVHVLTVSVPPSVLVPTSMTTTLEGAVADKDARVPPHRLLPSGAAREANEKLPVPFSPERVAPLASAQLCPLVATISRASTNARAHADAIPSDGP